MDAVIHEEEGYVVIPDDEGNKERFQILFTFEPETKKGHKYMLLIPETEDEDEEETDVYPFRYEEVGENDLKLHLIEDEEEWEMVEQVLNTFLEDELLTGEEGDSEK